MKTAVLFCMIMVLIQAGCREPEEIILTENSIPGLSILLPPQPTIVQEFAAGEMVKYLHGISGADFEIIKKERDLTGRYIELCLDNAEPGDGYTIISDSRNIRLSGNSDRAILYSVYDFLERLGCKFLAPEFSYYHGHAEIVPSEPTLSFKANLRIVRKPVFAYRKLDIAEGRSIDVEGLLKIIDWMPKNRLNTLMIPMNMNNRDNMVWDSLRMVIPEIEKRDIILEVGQHGYQNFLNAAMEDGSLFREHSDWFGKNSDCEPDPSEEMVFNLNHQEAVDYFIGNLRKYLVTHPEIDIFDLWPPDNARWSECDELDQDPPGLRQARFAEEVYEVLSQEHPGLQLQIIAFAETLEPVGLNREILLDICPIHQNFEKQIYDTSSANNRLYANAIKEWRKIFDGEIGLYSYYRKYAWKSLPNLIPHYMQRDLRWYAGLPLQGISCYAEQGDWYTYELNHYILSRLEWDPDVDVDSLVTSFCRGRYGPFWETALRSFETLEETVRIYGNIRHSTLKSDVEIHAAWERIRDLTEELEQMQSGTRSIWYDHISRLILMMKYAGLDLEVQEAKAAGSSEEIIHEKLERLLEFKLENSDKGILILSKSESLNYLREHYGVSSQKTGL